MLLCLFTACIQPTRCGDRSDSARHLTHAHGAEQTEWRVKILRIDDNLLLKIHIHCHTVNFFIIYFVQYHVYIYIRVCFIPHLFNYTVYVLLLFFCDVLSRGCCGAQISPFVGQTDSNSVSVSVLFCLQCNINLEAAKTLSMPEHNFNFIHDFKEMSVFPKMNIDHTFYPCKTARSMCE